MAGTLKDLDRTLLELEKAIIAEGPSIAKELAVNASALAQARIQKEGVAGKSYSTSQMLATLSMFNRKAAFKPTEIGSELGRGADGKLVKGGKRNDKGEIAAKAKAKKRWLWIRFPGAKKAVPVMILPGGYKELRKLNGLQTGVVDLTFTGRMFQNIKILRQEKAGSETFLAIIGATDKENKGKLAGNAKKYGNFLAPDKEEIVVLQDIQARRITEIIKRVLG
jgi:hypothetical protein